MTISIADLALYAGALLILFLTPGPVWVALIARAIAGGFAAAWPLALGVVIGDAIWPLLAIYGLSWVTSQYAGVMIALQWVAVGFFLSLGIGLIRNAGHEIGSDSRLTRPGIWAGFLAGLAAILGNPKAILFYMGVLPGFFDLSIVTPADTAAIVGASIIVPLFGNLVLAAFVDRARRVLSSPDALRRMNLTAGWMLIAVGAIIGIS
ncbi:threonine/homoserine/homoserine lactone efflux protein [Aliiruegeria haliotis]|uniref:Threonine/homoserine/homoserine lactone efflux protein n=1 Tax=Aliiruegeria haliotis TaxID=1280846 RepID=A0A2T0REA7_9RHOB|nr:LysE family translocator [Aliiruegeria haliotis]PRY19469.1 threonine/homoserine/homoserine lactone efflux protein [Aliiruegeria haliotis]